MKSSFFSSPGWQILVQTDIMTKMILMSLFAVSVVCIAIIVYKFIAFRKQTKQMQDLLRQLRTLRQFTDLVSVSKEFKETVGGKLLVENLSELRAMLDRAKKDGGTTGTVLTDKDFEDLEIFSEKLSGSLLLEEEVYLPVLGSCAAVGPLIGLFGTIWGLIHAFLDISQQQSTDIATVAPGIAEALITTLGGLIVAIPAMVAFHYFSNELRKLEFQLGDVSDKFLALAKQAFVK